MKMHPYTFFLILIFFISCQKEEEAITEAFDITISKTLFEEDEIALYDFVITDDQSIVVAYNGIDSLDLLEDGVIDSTTIYLQKLNGLGKTIWVRNYPLSKASKIYDVIQAMDGGYFLLGSFNINVPQTASDKSTLLLKVDSEGQLVWQKNIKTGLHGRGFEMEERSDGRIIVIGQPTFVDLIEIDEEGTLQRANRIPIEQRDFPRPSGMCLGHDEKNVVCGSGMIAYREGVKQWDFEYEDDDPNFKSGLQSICPISVNQGGGYLGYGYRTDKQQNPSFRFIDYLLVRVDDDGNVIWEKTFDSGPQDFGYDINPTDDGHFIAIGKTGFLNGEKGYAPIYKFDIDGNILWNKRLTGGSEYDVIEPSNVRQFDDNHILCMYVELKVWEPQVITEIKISKIEIE